MANVFLNTGRTVRATSNPQANVEQVQPTNTAVQPVQQNNTNNVNNANISQGQNGGQQQSNSINPITIPIQIQPQIAQTGQTTQQGTNNQQNNIQTLSAQPEQRNVSPASNSAPTPQTYQGQNTNNNVVDFNQIYSSYQSAFGSNSSNGATGSSGIKKTSIGTTIVTPTNTNLNTVDGMYQSAYADTINSLISQMLTQLNNGFQYDPTQDEGLKVATEYAANSTLQSLAGSGVLNSSATAERVARVVSELIPQYEEKAYGRWTDYLGQLADTAQLVMNYDAQQFEYWKDAKDREFQEKQFAYQKQQDALENAWKRVDELGYVDNEASAILGVPVGTLSGEARLAKEQREFELRKMREQAQIEYENNKALYQLKSELDKDQQKYAYELERKYGTSKSSSTNYKTYDEIIKNRYAEYDSFTQQYVVPDEQTYNELGEYLDTLNANGLITDEEFLQLSAKYSKYATQNSSTNDNDNSESNNTNQKEDEPWWKQGLLTSIGSLLGGNK